MSEKIQTNTNEALRKKYFVDSKIVITGTKELVKRKQAIKSSILDSSHIVISSKSVCLHHGAGQIHDQIRVNVIRDGNVIKRIKISCPCGRTAELDCQYA